MKKLFLLILLALPVFAQWTDVSGNIGASNLYTPLNGKVSVQIVAGAPTSLACTAGKDLAFDSSGIAWYACTVSGTPGTWAKIDAAMTFSTGLTRSGNAVTCLTASGSQLGCISAADWTTFNGKVSNPMSAAGDIIVGGASGTPTRLASPGNGTWCYNISSGTATWTTCPGATGGLADPGGNGILSRTSAGTTINRTLTGTANLITITNGDGTGGNPTFTVGSNVGRLDQGNTWATGAQDMSSATNFRIPNVAGYTPTLNGHFGYDSTSNVYKGYVGAAVKTFVFTDGNVATATALAGTPTKCSAGNYPLGVDAQGNAQNCTAAPSGTISGLTTGAIVTAASSTSVQTPNTSATMDSSGNISTPGTISSGVGASNAGAIEVKQGTANTPGTNAIDIQAPTAVTAYAMTLPGTAGTGFYLGTNSSGTVTLTQVGSTGSGNVVRDTSPTISNLTVTGSCTGCSTTSGTVTSVGVSSTDLSVSGSPVTSSGNITLNIAANAVTSAKLAVVNTRRNCMIENDSQSATVLTDSQITGRCDIPAASTLVEVAVYASGGTPTVLLERWRPNGGTVADLLSATLPTAASGAYACAMASTSQTCIAGITSSGTVTLSNTSLAAGDVIRVKTATAGGTATWHHIVATYTIN